jgi:uncharacterized protein YcnI
MSRLTRAAVLAAGLIGAGAAQAQAHAIVSPAVGPAGKLQQYTLSVPTEKEGATTTRIELNVPDGFAIDSYEAEPGWKRVVSATGSGEEAVVHKVTWSGGKVPTDEDAVFRFNASATKAQDYKFTVRQTYSNGSVVDWSGSESSDTPAPVIEARSDLGGGGGSSSTLAVIALVAALIALGLAVAGLAGARGGGRSLA